MSYAAKGEKVFLYQDPAHPDCTPPPPKRSDHRLKRFQSTLDKRAWHFCEEIRSSHFHDLMTGSRTCLVDEYHKYVPLEDLIRILMAEKDELIRELEERLRQCCQGDSGEKQLLQNQIAALTEEVNKSREMLRQAIHKLENIDEIVNENKKLQCRLRCSEDRVKYLEEKKKHLETELADLRSKSQIQMDLEQAQRMLTFVTKAREDSVEMDEAVLQCLALERDQLQEKVKNLEKELEESRKKEAEIEMLKKRSQSDSLDKEEMSRENECYRKKLASMKCLEKQIQELKKQGRALADKYKREAQKAAEQMNKMCQASKELQCLREERDSLRKRVNELSSYECQYNKLQRKLQRVDAIIAENENLNCKLLALQKLEEENEFLKCRLEAMQEVEMNAAEDKEKIMQLQCAVADQEEEMKDLLCQIERLTSGRHEEELERLKCELYEKNSKLKLCEEQLAEIPMLEAEIDELRMKLQCCCREFPEKKRGENSYQKVEVRFPATSTGIQVKYKTPGEKSSSVMGIRREEKVEIKDKHGSCQEILQSDLGRAYKVTSECSQKKDAMSCEEVQSLLQSSKGIISCVLEDMIEHQKEMEELEMCNRSMKEEIEALKAKIGGSDKDSLLEEISCLKRALEEKDEEISRLQSSANARDGEDIDTLKELNRQMKVELEAACAGLKQVANLEKMLEKEHKARCEAEIRLSGQGQQRPAETSSSRDPIEQSESGFGRSRAAEVGRVSSEDPDFDCCKSLQRETDDLKAQIEALNKLTEELKRENELLRELQQPCPDFSKELDEKCALENLLSLLQAELDAFKGQKLSDECEALRNELKRVMEQNCQLKALLDCYRQRLDLEKKSNELNQMKLSGEAGRRGKGADGLSPSELDVKEKEKRMGLTPSGRLEGKERGPGKKGREGSEGADEDEEGTDAEGKDKKRRKGEGSEEEGRDSKGADGQKRRGERSEEEETDAERREKQKRRGEGKKSDSLSADGELEGKKRAGVKGGIGEEGKEGRGEREAALTPSEALLEKERLEAKAKGEAARSADGGKLPGVTPSTLPGASPSEIARQRKLEGTGSGGGAQEKRFADKQEGAAITDKSYEEQLRALQEENDNLRNSLKEAEKRLSLLDKPGEVEKDLLRELEQLKREKNAMAQQLDAATGKKAGGVDATTGAKVGGTDESTDAKPRTADAGTLAAMAATEKEKSDCLKELEQLRMERNNLTKQLADAGVKPATADAGTTAAAVAAAEKEKSDCLKQLEQLRMEKDNLAKQLADAAVKPATADAGTTAAAVAAAEKEKSDCLKQLEQLKMERDNLAKQLAEGGGKPATADAGTAATAVAAVEKEKSDCLKELEALKKQLADNMKELEQAKNEKKELASKVAAEQAGKPATADAGTAAAVAAAEKEKSDCLKQLEQLKMERDNLAKQLAEGGGKPATADAGTAAAAVAAAEKEKSDCLKELEALKKQLADNTKELEQLRNEKKTWAEQKPPAAGAAPGVAPGAAPGAAPGGVSDNANLLRELEQLRKEKNEMAQQLKDAKVGGAPPSGAPDDWQQRLRQMEAENAEKLKKLMEQHEKELANREKTYNENLNSMKTGYETDIRKLAERHKLSIMRLQELHEDEVQEMNVNYETQLETMQTQSEAAINDVAKGSAAKARKLAEQHSRDMKDAEQKFHVALDEKESEYLDMLGGLRSKLTQSMKELETLKKRAKQGGGEDVDKLKAQQARELQKARRASKQKIDAVKEKMEKERRKSEAEIEALKKQLKEQEKAAEVCECKFSKKKPPKRRDPTCPLDFNEVLEKILEEGLDSLTFNEIALVHRKTCCALEGIVMRSNIGPTLELEPPIGDGCPHTPLLEADKQQLLSRIFDLENAILQKQRQTQDAIVSMEVAIKKERCRLQEVRNSLLNEQQKNSELKQLLSSQTKIQTDLKKERDKLGNQASMHESLCQEKSKQLDEEMKNKKCLEEEVDNLRNTLKQVCMTLDAQREKPDTKQGEQIEIMRQKLEQSVHQERRLALQLENETKCRLQLQCQLQALRQSLKHVVELPAVESANRFSQNPLEAKSAKEKQNLDQINEKRNKIKTKSVKKQKK